MMSNDSFQAGSSEDLVVVFSAKDEVEATLVVNALESAGLQAMMQGQHVSSFRAENWVDVKVVTRAVDAFRAQQIVAQLNLRDAIDWDQVDVGEPND